MAHDLDEVAEPASCFSLARRRAVATLPLLQPLLQPRTPDKQILLTGLEALSSQTPELRKPAALAAKAAREIEKYAWAFPADDTSMCIEVVARAGFDHSAAIIDRLRSALPLARDPDCPAVDKLLAKAFRAAVRDRKADSGVNIEKAALKHARSKLAAKHA